MVVKIGKIEMGFLLRKFDMKNFLEIFCNIPGSCPVYSVAQRFLGIVYFNKRIIYIMKHFVFSIVLLLSFVVLFGVSSAQELVLNDGTAQELASRYENSWGHMQKNVSEEIGEYGAEKFAQNQGWEKVLTKADKSASHPQGFDQIWRDSSGNYYAIEAKGNSSPLKQGYGYKQGTVDWCIEVAKDKSAHSTYKEVQASKDFLNATKNGKSAIYTIRTKVTSDGKLVASLEKIENCIDRHAGKAARALKEMGGGYIYRCEPAEPEVPQWSYKSSQPSSPSWRTVNESEREVTRTAEAAAKGASKGVKAAAKGARAVSKGTSAVEVATGVGVVVDVGFRAKDAYDTEQEYYRGEIDHHERVVKHVKNGAGMVGGWGGAAAGGYAGAAGGAAAGAAVGSVVPVVGTAIGGAVGGVLGGVGGAIGGYFFGETAAEATVDYADEYFNQ